MSGCGFVKAVIWTSTFIDFIMMRTPLIALVIAIGTLPACNRSADVHPETPQGEFWTNMLVQCGNAYEGRLVTAPEGDEMLSGDERLVVHFRECEESEMRLPFHIERPDGWDRSRTWVYARDDDGLELRHDHRHADGSPEEDTWYGGRTQTEGSANQQEFVYAERTAPDGSLLGWRIQIVPGERYTYGTFRGDDYTWRVDFDLSRPVEAPPAPWGDE